MNRLLVTVCPPGQASFVLTTHMRPQDSKEDIALRMAANYPPRTLIGVDGTLWESLSREPPKVQSRSIPRPQAQVVVPPSLTSPKPAPVPQVPASNAVLMPRPGEVWRPKDPRRKSTFTVREIRGDEIVADDGRVVQLSRLSRYQKVN